MEAVANYTKVLDDLEKRTAAPARPHWKGWTEEDSAVAEGEEVEGGKTGKKGKDKGEEKGDKKGKKKEVSDGKNIGSDGKNTKGTQGG